MQGKELLAHVLAVQINAATSLAYCAPEGSFHVAPRLLVLRTQVTLSRHYVSVLYELNEL